MARTALSPKVSTNKVCADAALDRAAAAATPIHFFQRVVFITVLLPPGMAPGCCYKDALKSAATKQSVMGRLVRRWRCYGGVVRGYGSDHPNAIRG